MLLPTALFIYLFTFCITYDLITGQQFYWYKWFLLVIIWDLFIIKLTYLNLVSFLCDRNYVVQYIIEQKSPSAIVNLLSQFKRHYVHLSMQKFSSHVVEKCLKHLNESREQIVRELISVPRFEQLLQDPFANYVIQSALVVTKVWKLGQLALYCYFVNIIK